MKHHFTTFGVFRCKKRLRFGIYPRKYSPGRPIFIGNTAHNCTSMVILRKTYVSAYSIELISSLAYVILSYMHFTVNFSEKC